MDSQEKDTAQTYISNVLPKGLWWNQFFCSSCGSKVSLVVSMANQKKKTEKIYAARCDNEKCQRNNGGAKPDMTLSVSL